MLIFFKRRKIFCLPKLYVRIQIGVENNSARFSIKDDSGCVPLGLKWASPPFFWGTDCILNTDLTWLVELLCIEETEKKKVLERNAGHGMKAPSPVPTSAGLFSLIAVQYIVFLSEY